MKCCTQALSSTWRAFNHAVVAGFWNGWIPEFTSSASCRARLRR